jgi:hypothetical protein
MDQARLLIVAPVVGTVAVRTAVTVDNPRVFVSSLKSSKDGKTTLLTLRSVSDNAETATLTFPNGTNKQVSLLPCGITTLSLAIE